MPGRAQSVPGTVSAGTTAGSGVRVGVVVAGPSGLISVVPKNSDTLPVTSTESPTAGDVLVPVKTKIASDAPGVSCRAALPAVWR